MVEIANLFIYGIIIALIWWIVNFAEVAITQKRVGLPNCTKR